MRYKLRHKYQSDSWMDVGKEFEHYEDAYDAGFECARDAIIYGMVAVVEIASGQIVHTWGAGETQGKTNGLALERRLKPFKTPPHYVIITTPGAGDDLVKRLIESSKVNVVNEWLSKLIDKPAEPVEFKQEFQCVPPKVDTSDDVFAAPPSPAFEVYKDAARHGTYGEPLLPTDVDLFANTAAKSEPGGTVVHSLPSLSGPDSWHDVDVEKRLRLAVVSTPAKTTVVNCEMLTKAADEINGLRHYARLLEVQLISRVVADSGDIIENARSQAKVDVRGINGR